LKLPLKSVAAGWNATRPAEVASSGLEISISGRSCCSAVEVADLQLKLPIFRSPRATSAECITIRRTRLIFSRRRAFSICSVKLQPNSRNFSRTGVTPKEVRRFQPDLRFSGFLHRKQIASRHLRPDRYHFSALAGFPVRLAHLQPNSDFSAGIGFGAPIRMPLRLLSSISSGT
jgi:hypothetical protein